MAPLPPLDEHGLPTRPARPPIVPPRSYARASAPVVPPKPPAYESEPRSSLLDAVPATSFFAAPKPKQPVKAVELKDHVMDFQEDPPEAHEAPMEGLKLKSANPWKSPAWSPASVCLPGAAPLLPRPQLSTAIVPYGVPVPPLNPHDAISSGPSSSYGSVGWITPKVFALAGDGGGIAGVWEDSLWDFKITASTDPKVLPMGEFPPRHARAPKAQPEEDAVASAASNEDESTMSGAEPLVEGAETKPSAVEREARVKSVTQEELDSVRPHPNAFWSRSTRSWVIFTPVEPDRPPPHSLNPDQRRHHFWRVKADSVAPSAIALLPPFAPANPKQLSAASNFDDADLELRALTRLFSSRGGPHFAYSDAHYFPTVIPQKLWDRFDESRGEPRPGDKSRHVALLATWAVVWRAIDSLLFKGETRALLATGAGFAKRMPWDTISKDLFIGVLGASDTTTKEGGIQCTFPTVDDATEEGRLNRRRLLRCWLEISLVIYDIRVRHPDDTNSSTLIRLEISSARPRMVEMVGGDNIPRLTKGASWSVVPGSKPTPDGLIPGATQYHLLGVTPDVADSVVIEAYDEQMEFDSKNGMTHLEALDSIGNMRGSDDIRMHATLERSKGLISEGDLGRAYGRIGCTGPPDPRLLTEDVVCDAYTRVLEAETDLDRRAEIREALRIIAEFLASDMLRMMFATAVVDKHPLMDVEKAYTLLQVSSDFDDDTLMAMYGIRIEDQPGLKLSMRDALVAIAESRESGKLRHFLDTGETSLDGWESMVSTSLTRPVGLTNIANTCYLNSLLQYFFTVRELRDTILHFKIVESPGVSTVRVGGRLVTEAEIDRSKRFVVLLQALYNQLIHAPTTSVTPVTELAYLALVPSKEENDLAKPPSLIVTDDEVIIIEPSPTEAKSPSVLGKRRSDHLDETVALEGPVAKSKSQSPAAASIEPLDEDTRMQTGSPEPHEMERARQTRRRAGTTDSLSPLLGASSSETLPMTTQEAMDGVVEISAPVDVEMDVIVSTPPSVAPPLPPRRQPSLLSKVSDLGEEVANYMAFGKQNDVTECMDNVMFQIECALIRGGSELESEESLVKRLFYGKMKQTLELDDTTHAEPVRVKDEPFAYLLVDVASEGRNLYDGLDMVFDSSLVSIDGMSARKRMSLVDVPPILQIQMQRVQYDKKEQKIFKSNAHMSFGDTLCMDRYLEVDERDEDGIAKRDATNEHRRTIDKSRSRLEMLTKDAAMPQVLRDTVAFLAVPNDDLVALLSPEFQAATLHEAELLSNEIVELEKTVVDSKASIEALWRDAKAAEFQLVSVFMHRGTALSGHYYIFQRDSTQPEKWLKYNDSLITDIDPTEEIFKPFTGDANPYFLVWVRTDRLDAIESIKRETQPGGGW